MQKLTSPIQKVTKGPSHEDHATTQPEPEEQKDRYDRRNEGKEISKKEVQKTKKPQLDDINQKGGEIYSEAPLPNAK